MTDYSKHFYWLDLLRFSAAMLVTLAHVRGAVFVDFASLDATSQSPLTLVFFALTRLANEAVVVFFVLSGFLVGGKAIVNIRSGQFACKNYIIDRTTRIFIPLIPALALSGCVLYSTTGNWALPELIGNLVGLQGIAVDYYGGNDPLWSLAYEFWFYILVLVAGVIAANGALSLMTLGCLAVIFIVFCYLDPTYLFCWLLGAVVFVMPPSKRVKSTMTSAIVLSVAGVIGIQLTSGSQVDALNRAGFWLPPIELWRLLLSFGVALFIRHAVLIAPKSVMAIGAEKLGSMMARSSYTLYLTHFPVVLLLQYLGLQPAEHLNAHSVIVFISVCVLCLLVSGCFYLVFEKQTRAIRERLKGRQLAMGVV